VARSGEKGGGGKKAKESKDGKVKMINGQRDRSKRQGRDMPEWAIALRLPDRGA